MAGDAFFPAHCPSVLIPGVNQDEVVTWSNKKRIELSGSILFNASLIKATG